MESLTNSKLTLDSREIAKMIGKDHAHLIRDIETYISYLSQNPKLVSDDFFIEDNYKAGTGKPYKYYQVTKKGCELIAHKMTGEKGVQFTATYINRFHDMEQTLKQPIQPIQQKQVVSSEDKHKSIEAKYNNSLARKANILLKMTKISGITNQYKQVLCSYASAIIADKPLLPLPELQEETLTAEQVGKECGEISGNMIGRIAKEYNLKTDEYGKWFHDKSKYSNKEVPSFRYYKKVIPVIKNILKGIKDYERS